MRQLQELLELKQVKLNRSTAELQAKLNRCGMFLVNRIVGWSAPDRPGGIAEVFILNVHNVHTPLSFGLRRMKFETQFPKRFSHSEVNECSQSRRIAGCEIRYPEDYRHKRIIESQRKVQKIPNTCISFWMDPSASNFPLKNACNICCLNAGGNDTLCLSRSFEKTTQLMSSWTWPACFYDIPIPLLSQWRSSNFEKDQTHDAENIWNERWVSVRHHRQSELHSTRNGNFAIFHSIDFVYLTSTDSNYIKL